jgi:hypothetical protein
MRRNEMRVKLMTQEIRSTIPALYSQENVADPKIAVKFFTPDAQWTWYATEGEPIDAEGERCSESGKPEADWLFFGLVDGFEKDLGYFTLGQLETVRGGLGLPVERDRFFTGTLSEVRA